MAVVYENLVVAGGRFSCDGGDIELITVPATTTFVRGTVLGKITADGKYAISKNANVDGTEVAVAILEEDAVNTTGGSLDVKAVVWKKGTFNTLGVTFGTGQTRDNTQDDLHNVSIEITEGVA